MAVTVVAVTISGGQGAAQSSGRAAGTVVPVYRDLLNAPAVNDAFYAGRCGVGAGPLEILRADTPREASLALVGDLDAAGVVQMAEQALARAAAALPGANVTICLFPGELSRGLPYLDGVGGVAFGGGRIKLLLHPKPRGLRRVRYTVAHEYHHEAERLLGSDGWDPVSILVREGKADHFAVSLYPELRPPHTRPLDDTELEGAWSELLAYDRGRLPVSRFRSDFMIGRNPRVLPWPGYRLGFEMVEFYFRANRRTPAESARTSGREIFEHFLRSGRIRRP